MVLYIWIMSDFLEVTYSFIEAKSFAVKLFSQKVN